MSVTDYGKLLTFLQELTPSALDHLLQQINALNVERDLPTILKEVRDFTYDRTRLCSKGKKDRKTYVLTRQKFCEDMPFCGREEIAQTFVSQVEKNFELLFDEEDSPLKSSHTKSHVKFPMLTGIPGIGKSTFGRKFPELLRRSDKLSSMKTIPIYISLHSSEAYCMTEVDRELEPEQMISLRIFWYWFFSRHNLHLCWQAFIEFLKTSFKGDKKAWKVFSTVDVFRLIVQEEKIDTEEMIHFIIHVDDVNEAHSYDVTTDLTETDPKKASFYRLLKGIGSAVFSARTAKFFVTPLLTGTTQIYMNLVFEASGFSPLQERLTLLSREDTNRIVTHYAKSEEWKQYPHFVAIVEAVQGLPRALEELLWFIIGNPNYKGFWQNLGKIDYDKLFEDLRGSIQSLYGSSWYSCGSDLLKALVYFALSGISLPKSIIIENMNLQTLEDRFNVNFEEEKSQGTCVLQIPYIVLSIIMHQASLPHYKYDWLRSPKYITGPIFDHVEACYEEIWNLSFKLRHQYMGESSSSIKVCDYYRGAIGQSETLQQKITLPKVCAYVESYVQIAVNKQSEQGEEKVLVTKAKNKQIKEFENASHDNKLNEQDGDVQMCDWTSGYIIRNGPSANSWDLGRAVNFPKSLTRLFVGKQLKFMAVQSPSKQTGEEFAKTFKRELLSEYNKFQGCFNQMCKDRENEKWEHLFVFFTNWPLQLEFLDIETLPKNILVYCEKNLGKYYSRVVHSRLLPWIDSHAVTSLLEKLSVQN